MLEAFVHWIREYYQRPEGIIPLHETYITENEHNYIKDCLDSGVVSSVGSYVEELEGRVRQYTGAPYAIAMINGTSALHMALMLVGVQPGELVITTPFTFVATANAIHYTGASPLFLDIDRKNLGLSPRRLREFLTKHTIRLSDDYRYHKQSGRRIAACIPVHAFGHPAAIDEILNICSEFHVPVIEDAAESLGSWYKKQHTGTQGAAGIFSFNGNKIITCGGGGMLVTHYQEIAEKALHLSTQARVRENYGYWHDQIGYNYRMPNLNAALGCGQIEYLKHLLKLRKKLAEAYQKFFEPHGISLLQAPAHATSNYWMQAAVFKNEKERDNFVHYTNQQGIHTRPAWQLLLRFPMFAQCYSGSLEDAEFVEKHVACLPSFVVEVPAYAAATAKAKSIYKE